MAEVLSPTKAHLLYSETRQSWVAAGDVKKGETLKTQAGAIQVASAEPLAGVHHVYNLEIEGDHRYFVGHARALSHNTCTVVKNVEVSKGKYPEEHALAEASGNPSGPFTKVDKATRDANRAENLKGVKTVPGKDRGEWPPAMTAEGKGAAVRPINPGQNRGSGATIGNQTKTLKPGEKFKVKWKD